MLVNLDPDDPGDPHTFELTGDAARVPAPTLTEGDRVEVVYEPVEHEVVDPGPGPAESFRAEVVDVRVLGALDGYGGSTGVPSSWTS